MNPHIESFHGESQNVESVSAFDSRLLSLLQVMAGEGAHRAAQGLAGMIGESLTVAHSEVRLVNMVDLPHLLGGMENEAVGIYLQAAGGIGGQMMLIFPYAKALELTDLLLERPHGSTTLLGSLERSALAEVGNITGSYFLNAVATLLGLDTRPSPPAVMVDMVGAILDVIIATAGGISDQVLMIRSGFTQGGREVQADFWVLPDVSTLELLAKEAEHVS